MPCSTIRISFLCPGEFADRLSLTASSRVLEVGPGSGYFSVEIARRTPQGHLELFDLQLEMLGKARRKLQASGLNNVGYTQGDAANLPFADASFDMATLVAVLGEVPESKDAQPVFIVSFAPAEESCFTNSFLT